MLLYEDFFTKYESFFHLFIMADTNFPFLLTLRKAETQTLGRSVIRNFAVQQFSAKMSAFFQFFIMVNAIFPFFSGSVYPSTCHFILGSVFNIQV